MNQNLRRYLSVFLFTGLLYSSSMFGLDVWTATSAPPENVLSVDLIIDGGSGDICLGQCATTIEAMSCDVNVTITNADSVVKGNPDGPSQLYLHAAEGYKITFSLEDFDLTFKGSADGSPLLVVVSGAGQVIFKLKGGREFCLASGTTEIGGVKMYVEMADLVGTNSAVPTLCFERNDGEREPWGECDTEEAPYKDVTVKIGSGSLLSYLSYNTVACANDAACIKFDPTNKGNGRMILDIEDCGGLIIAGHKVSQECAPCVPNYIIKRNGAEINHITCDCIDARCAAGKNAIFKVVKTVPFEAEGNYHAGLQIRNKNCKLFELLADPFCNLRARCDVPENGGECPMAYKGSFSGVRYGFVLGANGCLDIQDGAYLDYVALKNNLCPDIKDVPGHADEKSSSFLKLRNPSAFWVDGNNDPASTPAKIQLGDCSGLFFRSGVNKNGEVCYAELTCYGDHSFTVDACDKTPGAGEYVFIVEAPLNVYGSNDGDCQKSKIELLSLHVNHTGGTLFADSDDCYNCEDMFPKRSFDRGDCSPEQGPLYMYNKGAFLINDCVNLFNTSLDHTDVNHLVLEKNDLKSEPTYVGGESWWLKKDYNKITCDGFVDPCPVLQTKGQTKYETNSCDDVACLPGCDALPVRPKIALYGSRFNIHTDVAVTGMDLTTPNWVDDQEECIDNVSKMVFYQNGKRLDQGTGRNLVLGTHIGSTACNGCKIINRDAHLDVVQTKDCDIYCDRDHTLLLETAANSECIDDNIICDISKQPSMHNIFLGHDSNISVGTHAPCDDEPLFECETNPSLLINGNYFSFCTRGGSVGVPSASHITGKGGVFVDGNGTFGITPNYRASMSTMVTKSLNGLINLPKEQVVFNDFTGIAQWDVNLSDESQQVLIPRDQCISDYTFHWIAAKKNYSDSCYFDYCPYALPDANMCECPPVTQENVTSLPTVEGIVNQFQIQGARIGDEPQILVDGGHIRELVFLRTGHSGDAPVAVVVLKNHGRVGLNTGHSTPDSLYAATTFGINGVTIIADGDGRVDLNADMIIDNRCAFVKGPNFNGATDMLQICSDVERTLLVKSSGILDLQSFGPGDTVKFGGEIRLILEPGARIVLGGGTLQLANDVIVEMDAFVPAVDFFKEVDGEINPDPTGLSPDYSAFNVGAGLANTDDFRIKLLGTGTMLFTDDAKMYIDKDAFVGVETYQDNQCEVPVTDLTIELQDNALFSLGGERVAQGGSLQIGNTQEYYDHSVTFSLFVNGVNAQFRMGPQAFLGLNTGIVDRQNTLPNDWLIDVLYNVDTITINLLDGLFEHANIYAGNEEDAHLLALGAESDESSPLFTVLYENSTTTSLQRVSNADIHGGGNYVRLNRGEGAYKPIVLNDDDFVTDGNPNMRVSMFASLPLLPATIAPNQTANTFFDMTKTTEGTQDPASRSVNLGNASIETAEFSGINTELRVGYIDRGVIGRAAAYDVIDVNSGTQPDRVTHASERGAVGIDVNLSDAAAGTLKRVTQLS